LNVVASLDDLNDGKANITRISGEELASHAGHTPVVSAVVAVVRSRAEAELIAGMLRSHGLQAVASGDDAGGVDLALQSLGVRVLVPAAEAGAARKAISETGSADADPRPRNLVQRWLVRLLGGGSD
jgi:hypothetical protein